jgi:hypothetical protein
MTINFSKLVGENLQAELYDRADWTEWRYCYAAGRRFRDEYLERFSDRETKKEFARRSSLTPIPSYARLEINRVKNALSSRFNDISRRGGSKAWQDAVTGIERGVDRRGSSMNSYLSKYILPEVLVMRRVGVLVDAPRVNGTSAADIPQNFQPYLNYYPVEHIARIVPASVESPSDWAAVMVKDINRDFDPETGEVTDRDTFRYYYLDPERGNLVTITTIDDQGKEVAAPIHTNLDKVPFVLYDVLESLIRDVCSYQIAHLNLISADTSYALDANYPFMVRQRGNAVPAHLLGEEDEANVGAQKGLWYDKGLDSPGFISPPTEPMQISLELRKSFKEEVRELVTGALASLGEDGSMDSGLAFIGQCLEDAEARLWDHWTAYEAANPSRRRVPTIAYPDDWSLKTDEERIDEANKYIDLMNKLPGQDGKKEASKVAYERLFRGRLSAKDLDKIKAQVDAVPYTTSDAKIIIEAKKEGLVDAATGSMALGFDEGVAEKAKADQAEKAKAIAAAQSDQKFGGPGNPDASVDPKSNSVARQGDDPASGVQGRGEGKDNKEGEDE